jgi:hypothetical protein
MAANPRLRSRPPPGHQALFVTGAGLCARGWCSHAGTKSHPRDSVRAAAWISLQCDSRTDLERERSRRRMNSPDDCCHLGVARVPQRRSNRHYREGQRRQVAPDRWGIVGVEVTGAFTIASLTTLAFVLAVRLLCVCRKVFQEDAARYRPLRRFCWGMREKLASWPSKVRRGAPE